MKKKNRKLYSKITKININGRQKWQKLYDMDQNDKNRKLKEKRGRFEQDF
ncbi:unnamed protein product [Paramecium sonneborni]|uniref:Uncharacterized protein n=1 Tax=Paramecium sonneborni TaxID=65129 RepID=A0A8S1RAD9_9CILI|nr:unnamed protein product [Paramecium sonneborni]